MRTRLLAIPLLGLAVVLGGCHHATRNGKGGVTDLTSFESFIATHPTTKQFKSTYPHVQLIMPGMITSLDTHYDNTRYFPELDKDGHIIGGHFQ